MRWTSRKFWSMWAVFFFMRALLIDGKIANVQFVDFSLFLFGAYFTASVGKAAVDKWNGRFTAKKNGED